MAKSLVIVESPAKARTIKKYLGRNYNVIPSVGHIIDLPKSKLGVDIENDFEPQYITIRGKGPILKDIRKEAKKVDRILLATDPDREGEAISWHIANALKIPEDKACRIEFNEVTKEAVKSAVKKPRKINMDLVNSQQARRVLDRLVGYQISPLLWRKLRKGLSAGRVQSVATKIIVDREKEITSFISKEYWSINIEVKDKKNKEFTAKFYSDDKGNKKIETKEEADRITTLIDNKKIIVKSIKKSLKKRNPNKPFTTSTLQQEASNKLGFSTKKTMALAQQLYEGIDVKGEGTVGLITYMRTDSTRISNDAKMNLENYIINEIGKEYLGKANTSPKGKKNIQDAHEAIRPTSPGRHPNLLKTSLKRDQLRLYKLIWERFIASHMAPAVFDSVTLDLETNGITFKAHGSIMKFDGFLKIYTFASKSKDSKLPNLLENDEVKLLKAIKDQHFTQPPARFTEATLVKEMEELGIGRPSTYSPTISTILARGYVEKEVKQLKPTELGFLVTNMLENYFGEILNVHFTAELEKKLDNVEEGSMKWKELIKSFYSSFENMLKFADEDIEEVNLDEESDEICKKCEASMVIKHGRFGKFLACSNYPECKHTEPILNKIGVKCPTCDVGDVLLRKSRKGRIFFGCSRYPDCKFVSWDKPTNARCKICGEVMLHKKTKKEEKLVCISKDCKNVEEIKITEN
ncbi:MAG: DNA topoisomerase I [Alkaliphilus sp.]|nr:type I DNA topoisomerase [Alkaliphilus transvaalensis]MBN4069403.1 type I DNA topoisomerase [bacterium AH-315-G05]PHS35236.1 MAG: DNA topoisomerase I [Alkaliphilus sp.]